MTLHFSQLNEGAFGEFGLGLVTVGFSSIVATVSFLAISLSRYQNIENYG